MPDKAELPDKIVGAFLKAAQTGDKPLLSALLSTVARAETAKNNITFQLDSYQNSKFVVGKYEYVTPEKDGAHVACVWIDRDEKGTEYKHDVIWVLRKEEAGWRIVGMITRPFPDKDPVVFNYEDIPSLVAAKTFIQTESERREAEEEKQAARTKPDGTAPRCKTSDRKRRQSAGRRSAARGDEVAASRRVDAEVVGVQKRRGPNQLDGRPSCRMSAIAPAVPIVIL